MCCKTEEGLYMSFLDTLNQMLVVLFTIALGYAAHKLGYLGGAVNQKLSKIIIHIGIPALTLAAVMNNSDGPGLEEIKGVLWTMAAFYGLSFGLAMILPRFIGGEKLQQGVWRFSMVFSNAAFVGYPVVEGLFGAEGLFYAVILVLPMTLFNYTLAPLMVSGKLRFSWKQFFTPGTICAVLALAMTLTGWRPPAIVGEMMDLVGDITIPMSLLVLGSLLAAMPTSSVFSSPRLWILAAVRLFLMPAVLALVLGALGTDRLLMSVAVIQMAMPVAVNGSMMCMEFGGDAQTMAKGIFLSTVLCILTIPIVAAVFL